MRSARELTFSIVSYFDDFLVSLGAGDERPFAAFSASRAAFSLATFAARSAASALDLASAASCFALRSASIRSFSAYSAAALASASSVRARIAAFC